MKKTVVLVLVGLLGLFAFSSASLAATEQAKQAAIDAGLAWLAQTQSVSGSEGYWPYSNNGTLAATGSAALAFIEEGYLPGNDVIINSVNYGDVVGKACNYIFNRAQADSRFGWEFAGYPHHAEDYNNDGILNDGGNSQALFFNPGNSSRNVYTTGIVAPVVAALGDALGRDTVVGRGGVTATMTYRQVLRDVIDWFSWGQVEPNRGSFRGGWRYDANYSSSDNSTAQWGALPTLYGQAWGMDVPQFVKDELALWTARVQHSQDGSWMEGGSGYTHSSDYVNMSKTGGLMLEFAMMGVPVSDARVQNAIGFMEYGTHWTEGPYSTWYGNINHPYAMWAVYKALSYYGVNSISTAPGGFTIGQDWDPQTSLPGDWYAHYCDELVNLQNPNGSWNGYSVWTGALATGWYVNILNAQGVPEPVIPEPSTLVLLGLGLIGAAGYLRKKN